MAIRSQLLSELSNEDLALLLSYVEKCPDEKSLTELQSQITGTATDSWCPHVPFPRQQAFLDLDCEEAFYGGAAGGGKALAIETPIATPDGWSTMGQLKAGDAVFDDEGNVCDVLAASDVLPDRPCYLLTFSDGNEVIADGEHRWVTTTARERSQQVRRTPEFRKARRATRAKRGTGKRPDLAARNVVQIPQTLRPPAGKPRTTKYICDTAETGKQKNHAVEVAGALSLDSADQQIDPYVLGAWLGDGTSSGGGFSSNDPEIVEEIRRAGFAVTTYKAKYSYGILGLSPHLRRMGLLNRKRIPSNYLRASKEQRLALLQGLMDTDGTCCKNGSCEFYTTNPQLRDGVLELILSLGIKAAAREGVATLYGRAIGPKWRIKFLTNLPAFRLPRKLSNQKRDGFRGTHERRYIVSVKRIDSQPVRCIQVSSSSGCFLAGRAMIPTHNSDALLMWALEGANQPGYTAILFRRTYPMLSREGGLIPRSHQWLTNTKARWNGTDRVWRFPSGASITFASLQHEKDKYNFLSTEFTRICFDEVTQFSESQYTYLMSRNRVLVGSPFPAQIRCGSNPGGEGHLWMKNRFVTEEAIQALKTGAPGIFWNEGRAFVPAKLDDNQVLDREDYRRKLMRLDPVTRERLLNGDWSVVEDALISAEWLHYYDMRGQILCGLDRTGKRIELGQIDERECRRFATVDTAGTTKQKERERKGKPSSWSVCAVWDYWPKRKWLFLRHVWRDRVAFVSLCDSVERVNGDWHPQHIHIENAHLGPAVYDTLQGKCPVELINPVTKYMKGQSGKPGKVERATPLLNKLDRGEVFLPAANNDWLPDLEAEWLSWMGLEDEQSDQIDVASYAATLCDDWRGNQLTADAFGFGAVSDWQRQVGI